MMDADLDVRDGASGVLGWLVVAGEYEDMVVIAVLEDPEEAQSYADDYNLRTRPTRDQWARLEGQAEVHRRGWRPLPRELDVLNAEVIDDGLAGAGREHEAGHHAPAQHQPTPQDRIAADVNLDMLACDIADTIDRYGYPLDVSQDDVRAALPAFVEQLTRAAAAHHG